MKQKKLRLPLILMLLLTTAALQAQLGDVTKMMNAGVSDANILAKAYLNPWGKDVAAGLSNGWYNTAAPHGFLPIPGFDITISTTVAVVPSSDKTYDVSKLGLTALQASGNTIAPTVAGSNSAGPSVNFKQKAPDGSTLPGFNLPSGTGVGVVPLPMLQIGFGLPYKSEIDARYCPNFNIGKFGMGLWGVGLKHDIKQWIPGISKVPFWSMSAQAAFTSFSTSVSGTLLKPDASMYYSDDPNFNLPAYNNQAVKFDAYAFTANLIVSSDIPIINAYGSLGFTAASSTIKFTGTFPTPGVPTQTIITSHGGSVKSTIVTQQNPINLPFDASGFKALIGLRLKLGFFTLHADMSYVAGTTFYTGGLGFCFR